VKVDRPFRILVIEDNQPDVELLKILFERCVVETELYFARDGDEATAFLHRQGAFTGAPVIDLILMDLNIPRKNGRELLKEIKAHGELCRIPVIMITTSSSDREVQDSYCAGANAFISKPIDLTTFQDAIDKLVAFWFSCVLLPTRVNVKKP